MARHNWDLFCLCSIGQGNQAKYRTKCHLFRHLQSPKLSIVCNQRYACNSFLFCAFCIWSDKTDLSIPWFDIHSTKALFTLGKIALKMKNIFLCSLKPLALRDFLHSVNEPLKEPRCSFCWLMPPDDAIIYRSIRRPKANVTMFLYIDDK